MPLLKFVRMDGYFMESEISNQIRSWMPFVWILTYEYVQQLMEEHKS